MARIMTVAAARMVVAEVEDVARKRAAAPLRRPSAVTVTGRLRRWSRRRPAVRHA